MSLRHDQGAIRPPTEAGICLGQTGEVPLHHSQETFPGGESRVLYVGNLENPLDCAFSQPADTYAFLHVRSGCSLITYRDTQNILAPGHTVVLCSGHATRLRMGRNQQDLVAFFVPKTYMMGIAEWAAKEFKFFAEGPPHVFQLEGSLWGRTVAPSAGLNLAGLYSWATLQFSLPSEGFDSMLIHPGIGEGSPFEPLLSAVRNQPQESWSLRRAADMVGYSTFHFSRTFRAVTKMGFPAYVDRTRTDSAVGRILGTNEHFDSIAQDSGFGTTSSLRSALKEHLGLLPSELRRG